MNKWICFWFLVGGLWACDSSSQEATQSTIPTQVDTFADSTSTTAFDKTKIYKFMDSSAYEFYDWISLDIDGNGVEEHAVKVTRKMDQKKGVFIEKPSGGWQLMGAGTAAFTGGDDFRWMDRWQVWAKDSIPQDTYTASGDLKDVEMVPISGQALKLIQDEGASVFIYWKQGRYEWVSIE